MDEDSNVLKWDLQYGLLHAIPSNYKHLRLRIQTTVERYGAISKLFLFHPEKGWELVHHIYSENNFYSYFPKENCWISKANMEKISESDAEFSKRERVSFANLNVSNQKRVELELLLFNTMVADLVYSLKEYAQYLYN